MNCPDQLGAIHEVYYRVKEEAEKEEKKFISPKLSSIYQQKNGSTKQFMRGAGSKVGGPNGMLFELFGAG